MERGSYNDWRTGKNLPYDAIAFCFSKIIDDDSC